MLIGFDSVEISVLEELCGQGKLPAFESLRREGASGVLESKPNVFLSMVWPTFTTGTGVGQHAWYFNKLWNHRRMRLEYATGEWLPYTPFWEDLDPSRHRMAILDVPFPVHPRPDFNGVFLNGWQNHDDWGTFSHPRGLWSELRREVGRPAMQPEVFGRQDAGTLLRLREEVLASTEQFTRICEHVLARGEWDLFTAVYGAAHRGSHYLWNLSQIDLAGVDGATARLLENARVEIFQACDRALARLLEKAPRGARVMAFALHGMGPNSGWSEYFDRIAARLMGGGSGAPKRGLIYRMKKALPWHIIRQVTRRLPSSVNHALVPLWSRRMYDWSTVRFFPLPLDLNGFIRINLKGRETPGVIEPGAQYDELLDELEEGFLSFRDLNTGERVVASVHRMDDLVPPDSPRRDILPDLAVTWSNVSALESDGIRSEKYGEIRWEKGSKLPSGRSGNHLGRGWFMARGPGIAPGEPAATHDILDIAPTVCRWLGAEPPARLEGRPIPELTGGAELLKA
jgi:predicted AlkP superfamily phosphohydrolase/phosphomutase